ncbi:hypothetical protein, partial [Burkholderia cepacia]|uniref:hypothetical protein n=1 Tax=Burkholderia cepacia TaxID=292 RepID=UPI001C717CDF
MLKIFNSFVEQKLGSDKAREEKGRTCKSSGHVCGNNQTLAAGVSFPRNFAFQQVVCKLDPKEGKNDV